MTKEKTGRLYKADKQLRDKQETQTGAGKKFLIN